MTQPPPVAGQGGPPPGWRPDGPPVPPIQPPRQDPLHLLHAVITLFTCGLWAIFWIIIAYNVSKTNEQREAWYRQALADHTQAQWEWEQRHRT